MVGALAAGEGLPLRHLVEGAFTYIDPILIIATAMVFMASLEKSGALGSISRGAAGRTATADRACSSSA